MNQAHKIIEESNKIRQERMETLRLMIYVIILGIIVNALVSFAIKGNFVLTILFLTLMLGLSAMTIKYVILNPSVISDEFPTVLILDYRQNLISLPLVTRRPTLASGRIGAIGSGTLVIRDRAEHPFVINAFRAYLVARKDQKPDLEDNLDMVDFFDQLIVYLIIQKYFCKHRSPIWQVGKIHTQVDPFFSFGSYPSLPYEEVPFSKLAEEARNMDSCIARLYESSAKFAVPKGMQVTLLPPNASDARHKICFCHKLITLTISVGAVGGTGGISMKMWQRKMLGSPEDLYALRFTIEYEIKFHASLRRIRSSSKFKHICSWVSYFIEDLEEYVKWYNEEARFKDQDLIDFVCIENDKIIYSLREKKSETIAFLL